MKSITLTTVGELRPEIREAIVGRLTWEGSEWQEECREGTSTTPVAVWLCDGVAHGWACSHVWRAQQTLEMYVSADFRGRGIAHALSSVLAAAGVIDLTKTLAVFSPVTARIANRIGATDVLHYEWRENKWSLLP